MRTHATISCYNNGCRCADCRKASRDHRSRYRNPTSPRARTQMCVFCGEFFALALIHEPYCENRA